MTSNIATAPTHALRSKESEPKHFGYIDAIRGLAFLAVLVTHLGDVIGPFAGSELMPYGRFGVQFFFLASAVTLTHSMASRQKIDRRPVLAFFIRRFFRIAPMFWIAILLYWTVPHIMPPNWSREWAPNGVDASYFILTALFVNGWHPYYLNSIVPGGWSIAVEMNFYLVFPLIFRYFNTLKKNVVAVMLLFVFSGLIYTQFYPRIEWRFFPHVPPAVWDFFINRWFPSQLPAFLMGFAIYYLLQRQVVLDLIKQRSVAFCLICFSTIMLLSLAQGGKSGFLPADFFVDIAIAGIFVAIAGGSMPWIANPVIRYIGETSFSCYLIHFAVLYLVMQIFGVKLSMNFPLYDSHSYLTNTWFFIKMFVVTLGLTIAAATATLHLIERPGIALGKKIIHRLNARTPATSS